MRIIGYCMIPVAVIIGFYLYFMMRRILRTFHVDTEKKGTKWTLIAVSVILAVSSCWYSKIWALIIYHVVVIDIVLRLIDWILRKLLKEKYEDSTFRKWFYLSGLLPVVITVIIMITGRITMMQVVPTQYQVDTKKNLRPEGYKVILIADSHYGISLGYDALVIKCDEIEKLDPDMVILAGDIVDESTTPEQAAEVMAAFGDIKSTYGTYFVWGNHDRSSRDLHTHFSEEYLREQITGNGIRILEDECLPINDDLLLVGREDFYEKKKGKERQPIKQLMQSADLDRFVICIDHQPSAFEEEAEAGADLILCGHTHAGQLWPAKQVEELMHFDDGVYGRYTIGDTVAIVTSGFAGWSFPVKNAAPSEYVVIDIAKGNKN